VLGLFLIFGAVTIYGKSRATYRTTEAVARLQETARYAFDAIEPDVRMASYWGLANRPDYIVNRAGIGDTLDAELADAEAVINECSENWAVNLDQYAAAYNGADEGAWPLDCDPFRGDTWAPDTDILLIRRGAETQPDELQAGRIYIQSSRIQGTMFHYAGTECGSNDPKDPACIPGDYSPPASETRELTSTIYYISSESTANPNVPSLRRKRMVANNVLDEEVVSGVEDLQVRFGVNTDNDANNTADVYVDPEGDPADYGGPVVSATIWLRVRSDEPETGFTDGATYAYADIDAAGEEDLAQPADNFRRFVFSKTIQLRNTSR
jgi:type IV pilus assembly protein PilW